MTNVFSKNTYTYGEQEKQFIQDMRTAGFTVNEFTFSSGAHGPTVYGSIFAVKPHTKIPIGWKEMGSMYIIYPLCIMEKNA